MHQQAAPRPRTVSAKCAQNLKIEIGSNQKIAEIEIGSNSNRQKLGNSTKHVNEQCLDMSILVQMCANGQSLDMSILVVQVCE